MKASIGRIVMYVVTDQDKYTHECTTSILPAVIVRVWSDDMVNLKVFNDGVNDFWRISVVKNEGTVTEEGLFYPEYSWHWPVIKH